MLEKVKYKRISKGITRNELLEIINPINLSNIEQDILISYYSERKSLTLISYNLGYAYQYVEHLKKIALDKITTYYKNNEDAEF